MTSQRAPAVRGASPSTPTDRIRDGWTPDRVPVVEMQS
jgi:hypothetical protein